jgi:hypothetical protein
MKKSDMKMMEMIIRVVGKVMKAELAKRDAALEARPAVKWCGTWDPAVSYRPGDLAKWGGSVYIAKLPGHSIRPGDDGVLSLQMWDLFVQRGRQGRTGEPGSAGGGV